MKQRLPARTGIAATAVLALLALVLVLTEASAQIGGKLQSSPFSQARIPFEIATGPTAGTFFPVGEAIAGLISHPPGVQRCNDDSMCGPPGLIVSTHTSEGAVDNLIAVNNGEMESGLAQSDILAAAVKGQGPFRKLGPQTHIRVIASLFSEQVHLVVAANAKIHSVSDLRGKRLSLGSNGSGVDVTAREILSAWQVPESTVKETHDDLYTSVLRMKDGRLDGFFAVGGVPIDAVSDLITSGRARLVPLDGKGRDRLLRMVPSLAPGAIPAHGYPGTGATESVAARALWVVRDSAPDALVYAITRALFNPKNYDALSASHPSAREIDLSTAALSPPAPLHPGAARFYAEAVRKR